MIVLLLIFEVICIQFSLNKTVEEWLEKNTYLSKVITNLKKLWSQHFF